MATKADIDMTLLLDLPGGAALLGITVWQLRGLIASGELRVVRIGRKFYLRRQSLMRWAEQAECRRTR